MSIDYHRPLTWHLELGAYLKKLRREGVLIIGSGNVVHNLRESMHNLTASAFDWNISFNQWVKTCFLKGADRELAQVEKRGLESTMAVPTPDHYIPLLSVLGAVETPEEPRKIIYEETFSGLSMLSLQIGES